MLGKEMLLLASGEKDETGVLEIQAPEGFPDLTGVNGFTDEAGSKFPINGTSSASVERLKGIFPFTLHQERPAIDRYSVDVVENCDITFRKEVFDWLWFIVPKNLKKRSIVRFTYSNDIITDVS